MDVMIANWGRAASSFYLSVGKTANRCSVMYLGCRGTFISHLVRELGGHMTLYVDVHISLALGAELPPNQTLRARKLRQYDPKLV